MNGSGKTTKSKRKGNLDKVSRNKKTGKFEKLTSRKTPASDAVKSKSPTKPTKPMGTAS